MRVGPFPILLTFLIAVSSTIGALGQSKSELFPNSKSPIQMDQTGTSWLEGESVFRPDRLEKIANLPLSVGGFMMTDSKTGIENFRSSVKVPILKFFGSPPPIVKAGFSYTELFAAPNAGLPDDLYEYSIGVSSVRKLNDRWTLRTMVGAALATDNQNKSRDAWQFRGGIFAIRKLSDTWQWTLGAIALGRDDLPVLPAIGAVWTPRPEIRWDLIPPNPKVNFLTFDDGVRQNWVYLGAGFQGTTWGIETTGGDDQLTYRDLRIVSGWQSNPKAPVGVPFARGRKYNLEFGYIFSREFEFDREVSNLDLDDALMFRWGTDY